LIAIVAGATRSKETVARKTRERGGGRSEKICMEAGLPFQPVSQLRTALRPFGRREL
jgi:hypothetical protein